MYTYSSETKQFIKINNTLICINDIQLVVQNTSGVSILFKNAGSTFSINDVTVDDICEAIKGGE